MYGTDPGTLDYVAVGDNAHRILWKAQNNNSATAPYSLRNVARIQLRDLETLLDNIPAGKWPLRRSFLLKARAKADYALTLLNELCDRDR